MNHHNDKPIGLRFDKTWFSAVSVLIPLSFVLVMLSGCVTTTQSATSTQMPVDMTPSSGGAPDANLDPTATHLQDLEGAMLGFVAEHGKLPARLEDLGNLGIKNPRPAAIDPATGRPFVFNPGGARPKGLQGRLIVYQSIPTIKGGKWGILLDDSASLMYVQFVTDDLLRGLP